MKILNLANLKESDIEYKISKFPDGQQNITIDLKSLNDVSMYPDDYINDVVQIKSRLNNWLDLELISCTVASLRELEIRDIHLHVPYFLGARSDRMFERGGNYYLKSVICPVINSLEFKSISVLDPHSHVLGNCINNFRSFTNKGLVTWAIADLYHGWEHRQDAGWVFNLVSPDAGASHKIYKLAEEINYNGNIITCSKERDTEGKLTKTNVVIPDISMLEKDAIIIDDICDGGRTFINIAVALRAEGFRGKIYLIVTHGIFSAGFGELSKYFDGIYCTNSYGDALAQGSDGSLSYQNLVKQLNVF